MYACSRCREETVDGFTFYEVDREDGKHRFGLFCRQCTVDLVDELKGKVEWFHFGDRWRGLVRQTARRTLEHSGIIHTRYNTKCIEIVKENHEALQNEMPAILRIEHSTGLISDEDYRNRLENLTQRTKRYGT